MTNGMALYYDRINRSSYRKEEYKAPQKVRDACKHDWEEEGNYHGADVHRCKKCGEVNFGRH